jgi:mannose-6-phosphate isomerase-like protein (cupin superfamily)
MFLPDYRTLVRFDSGGMTKVNLFESHRLFADLYCLRPGQAQRVHTHQDNDKIYLVLEGMAVIACGGEEQTVEERGCCVARAGEPHGVRNGSNRDAVLLVIMAPHPKPPAVPAQ